MKMFIFLALIAPAYFTSVHTVVHFPVVQCLCLHLSLSHKSEPDLSVPVQNKRNHMNFTFSSTLLLSVSHTHSQVMHDHNIYKIAQAIY